jgi:hypothetical protein
LVTSSLANFQRHASLLVCRDESSFSDEIPSRFKKNMMKVFTASKESFTIEDLNSVLINIGRKDHILSENDMRTLVLEAESTINQRAIPSHKLIEWVA